MKCLSMSAVALVLAAGSVVAAQPLTRKVLIIGIDGCRPDCLQLASTPNIDALIAAGSVDYGCMVEDRTISGPCWSSMLTGVHRDKHGVTDNSFSGSNYDAYPHFFERLEQSCDISTASISNWLPINSQILRDRGDVVSPDINDIQVAQQAADLLLNGDPDIVFLQFDEVDGAGHGFGFDPSVPQYLAEIEDTDALIGQVLTALRARPTYASEDWLILLSSDHGGTIDRSHGRDIPEHRLVALVVSGLSAARGSMTDTEVVDLPATAMAFLGVPIDPAWNWDGQPVGLGLANSPSQPFPCVPPPTGATCIEDAGCENLSEYEARVRGGTWAGPGTACGPGSCPRTVMLFSENFDALPLGPNVDEGLAGAAVWTSAPPAQWQVERDAVPQGGITEWRGWAFADRSWWASAAGDQNRSQFIKGVGAVAIADPDEWDDAAHDAGLYTTSLSTPLIPLTGVRPESVRVQFDSSWRPECCDEGDGSNNQTARVRAEYYRGGQLLAEHEVLLWDSAPGSPTFHPDATNETVALSLSGVPGATGLRLRFTLEKAANDWWWAIDNLRVEGDDASIVATFFAEDFDGLPLGPNVDETLVGAAVWTDLPPAGWAIDESGIPGIGDPAEGVTEWEGWAFTDRLWWSAAAGDQLRSQFTRARGAVAVADPDEWDDLGNPEAIGPYNTTLATPSIDLLRIVPGTAVLSFDSSWRPEAPQRVTLVARFDGGAPVTLLDWRSDAGPFFKPDATNERVQIPVAPPAGARSVVFTWGLFDARNNWWWAIDEIRLAGRCRADLSGTADTNSPLYGVPDGSVDASDFFFFLDQFAGGEPIFADITGAADPNDPSYGVPDGQIDAADFFFYLDLFVLGCP